MFFSRIESLIFCKNFEDFYQDFYSIYDDFKSKKIIFEDMYLPYDACYLAQKFMQLFKKQPFKILHPTKIRRSKQVCSPLGMAKVLHSVAHIESSAILLALDSIYRFLNMPYQYYDDWLEVMKEEMRHFQLLNNLLHELGYKYGDFPIHTNLFEALYVTQSDLETRMGVVHRGLEARGLDSNPFVLKKLMASKLEITKKIEEVFSVILYDEISHVHKGDKWWKYSGTKTSEDFLKLCQRFPLFNFAEKTLNIPARIQAGFSLEELDKLSK